MSDKPQFDLEFWKELDSHLSGWMSEEEARFLVENTKGESYLEIGVAYGKSMRVIAHHFPDMAVGGVDLINHGVEKELTDVTVWYNDANKQALLMEDETVDTLFIDGNHTRVGVLSDFVHWYNKVKPGGRIIFHDYGRPTKEHEGVTQAVDAIKPLLKDFKEVNYICAGTK